MSEFLRNLAELTREAVFEESATDTEIPAGTQGYCGISNDTSYKSRTYNSETGICGTGSNRTDKGKPDEDWQSLFYDPMAANNVTEDHRSRSNPCKILTSLLHAECQYDCAYCRVCKRKKPASVTPKEMADYFTKKRLEGRYCGIFLSSGISGDVDKTMAEIIETGERIRATGFNGYMHLKILPGASRSDINAAAAIATRVSLNIETTSRSHMSEIANLKDYTQDILKRLDWLGADAPRKHSTQFIVGAADENDREIISCMSHLYKKAMPSRIYFSAFAGQKNTPMESHPDTPEWRTNRLYQTDFLLRKYSFKADEFYTVLDENEFLQNADPKMLLAEKMPHVDIKTADYQQLLRIPGIGPVSAKKICRLRAQKLKGKARKRETQNSANGNTDLSSVYSIIPARSLPYITLREGGIQSRIGDYL